MTRHTHQDRPVLEAILRGVFLFAVIASVVPFGSVHDIPYHLNVLLFSALLLGTLLIPFRNKLTRKYVWVALSIVLASTAYICLQIAWFPGNPLAHAMWEPAGRLIGFEGGSISVAPGATWRALPSLIIPYLVFVMALRLHQDDIAAQSLWQRLAIFGGVIAIYGIVQQVFFPEWVLFDKREYTDSLRANFVNRNNTAAFLALAALGLLALIITKWHHLNPQIFFERLKTLQFLDRPKYIYFIIYIFLFFFTVLAIYLTKSRAGAIFASISLLGAILVWLRSMRSSKFTRARWAATVLIVVLTALVFAQSFAGRTVHRAEISGVDENRICTYQAILSGIADHAVFGTGFGSFSEIFPTYRRIECGIHGRWARAHNSFLEGYLGLGLPFLAILGVSLFYLTQALRTGYRDRRRLRIISISNAAMLVFIALHSMLDFPLQIHGLAVYFAGFLGAGTSIAFARRTQP